MNFKKWILSFLVLFIIICLSYMFFNYKLDFYNYWKAGNEEISFEADAYTRIVKTKHIAENPDKYKGYIIGGSKAGVLDADLISKYEGKEFYNVNIPWGCFDDYNNYIVYIAENTKAEKIILHLSSIEVVQFSREQLPAIMTPSKKDDIKEKFQFLMVNPVQLLNSLKTERVFDYSNGNRNYDVQYKQMEMLGDEYFENAVLSEYDHLLGVIFNGTTTLPAGKQNIEALRNIVLTCKNHNIELEVVIGPTFITELYKFEGDEYWSYLQEIASIVEFWDFSGFNDVNRNPYNFINFQHYNNKVADKMINIMYGKDNMDGFGIHVNPNNFNEYINKRTGKYFEMKAEFEKTGTIKIFDRNHESYIK